MLWQSKKRVHHLLINLKRSIKIRSVDIGWNMYNKDGNGTTVDIGHFHYCNMLLKFYNCK